MSVQVRSFTSSLAPVLASTTDQPSLYWLGQAGFALKFQDSLALIDPYLSDALAKKYKGTEFPHVRMMATPVSVEALPKVRFVFITHRHGDHFDVETVLKLAETWPDCRFLLPAAEEEFALAAGLKPSSIVLTDALQTHELGTFRVTAIPAAHENPDRDDDGRYPYLGYVIQCGDATVYHSGDSVPFADLSQAISGLSIDVALLPVNGRDAFRASKKVPGNFTLEEAIELCEKHGIQSMIAHHFGMFEFNTISRGEIDAAAAKSLHCEVIPANLGAQYTVLATPKNDAKSNELASSKVGQNV